MTFGPHKIGRNVTLPVTFGNHSSAVFTDALPKPRTVQTNRYAQSLAGRRTSFTANANQSNESVTAVKINFPGSSARRTSFTANANQSNDSVTVVKINFHRRKNQFLSPCDTRTLPSWLRLHRWKLFFTVVDIDFYHGRNWFLPWWEIFDKF